VKGRLQKIYKQCRSKRARGVIAGALLALVAGCAQLPDYARPRFHAPDDNVRTSRHGFIYRPLAVADFQAVALPPEYSRYNHHINAHSCISIRPSKTSKARITRAVYGGRPFFVGSIPEVVFEAVFVPACSWWNPELPEGRRAYVLQHEQIHFALAELAARRLTRASREELKGFLAIHASYQEVQAELAGKLKDLAHEAMEASFAEHTAFDEETSLYFDPRAQQWWWQEVSAQLAETAP